MSQDVSESRKTSHAMHAPRPLALRLADFLLMRAERHARTLLARMPPEAAPGDEEMMGDTRERLRIILQAEYLFPQLARWQHTLLATLYWQRQTLTRLVNLPHQALTGDLRTRTERVTRQVEQNFMNLIREVKHLIGCPTLPPTQKILFERLFEHIEFEEDVRDRS